MKSRAFNFIISEAYRVEPKTVTLVTRSLKEAGLLTSGARGVNAPDMTPLDAARVTITLLATDRPSRAAASVRRFGSMRSDPKDSDSLELKALGITERVTLEEALTRFFEYESDPQKPATPIESIKINETIRTAEISHVDGCIVFSDTDTRSKETEDEDVREQYGARITREYLLFHLLKVSKPFFTERRDGITWEQRYAGSDANGVSLDPSHPENANLPLEDRKQRRLEINRIVAARLARRSGLGGDNGGK